MWATTILPTSGGARQYQPQQPQRSLPVVKGVPVAVATTEADGSVKPASEYLGAMIICETGGSTGTLHAKNAYGNLVFPRLRRGDQDVLDMSQWYGERSQSLFGPLVRRAVGDLRTDEAFTRQLELRSCQLCIVSDWCIVLLHVPSLTMYALLLRQQRPLIPTEHLLRAVNHQKLGICAYVGFRYSAGRCVVAFIFIEDVQDMKRLISQVLLPQTEYASASKLLCNLHPDPCWTSAQLLDPTPPARRMRAQQD